MRVGAEPFGQHDFLLVAAGEGFRRGFDGGGTHRKAGDVCGGGFAFGGEAEEAKAGGEALERGHAGVAAHAVGKYQALFFTVFGDEADAVMDGVGGMADVHGFVVEADFAARGHHAEDGVHHFGASGADEAEEAKDFAGMHGEGNVAEGAGMAQRAHFQRGRGGVRRRGFGQARRIHLFHAPPDHQADELSDSGVRSRQGGDVLAVAHDGDVVGEPHDFFHAVRDVDDRLARRLEAGDDGEEDFRFGFGERGGWLVEDDDFRFVAHAFGNFHQLPLRDGEVGDARVHIHRQLQFIDQLPRAAVERTAVDDAVACRFARGEDVFGDGEVVAQAKLLKDDGDAARRRLARACRRIGRAVERHAAAGGLMHSGENFDQRRFARAVLAEQGVYPPGAHVEADVVQGGDTGESFADAAQLQQGIISHGSHAPYSLPVYTPGSIGCSPGLSRPSSPQPPYPPPVCPFDPGTGG